MKTKRALPKRFSGTKRVSGILLVLLALALVFASAVSAAPFAFVSKNSSGTLSVIDGAGVADCLASQSPPCAIPVSAAPSGVAVNPAGTRAYVANKDSGTVSVINVETRSPVGNPITVGQEPWAVAVSTDGRKVYVALGNGGVAVINVDTNGDFTSLSPTIQGVGAVLNGIAVASGRVYVTDSSGGSVAVSDGTSVIGTISLGLNSAPNGIVASPSEDRIYVVHLFEDANARFHLAVAAIDTASNAVEIILIDSPTMAAPGGIAVSPDGTQLYVANDARGRLHIFNIQTQTLSHVLLAAGAIPVGVATTRLGTHVFVGGLDRNVSVIGTISAVCGAQTAPCLVRTVFLGSATFVAGAFATDGPQGHVLTVTSSPAAGGSVAPAGGTYAPGTDVTLTATAAAGYQFGSWSGDCSGSTNPCLVTMNAAKSVTANFTPLQHVLTVTSSPAAGGSITPAGGTYPHGTVVTLTVTPNVGYQFSGWSGDCSGTNACNVTMNQARSVTANFTQLHLLTVTASPAAGGSVNPPGGTYPHGTVVTLTVTPNAGYQFSGWSGACSGTNACNVTMDAAKSVTANFTLLQYPLTVTASPAAGGSITPAGGTYPYGTVVTLTVTPNVGYQFSGWSGACSGTNACNVTMNAAKSVTANFTLLQYPLTVTASPAAGGSVNPPGGTYPYGTVVTLTVTPNAGYQFSGWSGACSGTNACNVTMNAAKSVTATFTLLQYPLTVTASPAAGGSVNPPGGTYPHGTVVTLTVTPNAGYQFSGWSGACSGTGACNVTMDGAKSCTATFSGTPTTCDDKIRDLQKQVAADKHPWRHDHQLKAALRLYSAAQVELAKAKAKVGEKDKRYVHALKEFYSGKAALCSGRYRHAHHKLWESYALAHEILKHHHHRR